MQPSAVTDTPSVRRNRRLSVAPADDEDLPFAAMTARHIPTLRGTYQAIERVQRYSRSILAVRNKDEAAFPTAIEICTRIYKDFT
jgi:hypothetical protein